MGLGGKGSALAVFSPTSSLSKLAADCAVNSAGVAESPLHVVSSETFPPPGGTCVWPLGRVASCEEKAPSPQANRVHRPRRDKGVV